MATEPSLDAGEPWDAHGAMAGSARDASRLRPLRSVHTENFPAVLREAGISLVVSTYQAGRLVFLRADGERVNTHFCRFFRPMGIAVEGDRLAVGGGTQIWEFHNLAGIAAKQEPLGMHDACFMPRRSHVTGEIQIHEMEYGREGLWLVNTRFSCLSTLDNIHSFLPRWWPPFISQLTPEDRCHLNGLCMVEGLPCFVTALGDGDTAHGWRANKRDGGVLIEVSTGEILVRGLSMPHSPRWYGGRLWVLESGRGGLGYVDPKTLRYEQIVELPGFTRGLDFCGHLAFVGLSQVRESAYFGGIPITERETARRSGVWIVNIERGEIVAYLNFEEAVQELFAVRVLMGRRWPGLLNGVNRFIRDSFELPDRALDFVPGAIQARWPQRAGE